MKLSDLAARLGVELRGPGEIEIRGIAGLREAGEGDIAFLADIRRAGELERSRASAVIVPAEMGPVRMPALAARNPRLAFAKALAVFYPPPDAPAGVSDRSVIAGDAVIGEGAVIHPFVTVSAGARIGRRTVLHPGVFIGTGTVVGDDCVIHANASIREGVVIGSRVIIHCGAVLGSDGFGYVTDGGMHHKIPQVGGVVIGDDVEIGACCAIDRATLGKTVIGSGTKLDNMVHVAHNVTIGEHCLLAAQVGIAGSAALGSYVVMGGQAGVADHVTVGDRVMAGGGAGITREVAPGQVVAGHSAIPLKEWLKVQALLPKLPELRRRLGEMERRLEVIALRITGEEGRKR